MGAAEDKYDRVKNMTPEEYAAEVMIKAKQAGLGRPAQPSAVQIRIEALRAAATLVSSTATRGEAPLLAGARVSPGDVVIHVAEKFAAWLESGQK